jgi:hypothetical protein
MFYGTKLHENFENIQAGGIKIKTTLCTAYAVLEVQMLSL